MIKSTTLALAAAVVIAGASGAAMASQDDKGKKVFNRCKACHTLNEGGKHKQGPNLFGLFGRTAGSADGFKYTDAIKDSGVVWDETTLDAFLKDVKGYIPGNKMAKMFPAGVKKEGQRADLIAYLKEETEADD